MKNFCADFETATWNENETWVWAWCIVEIGNEENIQLGNSIESFIEFCKKEKNPTIYFHNLKFDGSFILWWLLKNGFEHITDRKDRKDRSFTTLISDMGQFYQIEIFFEVGNKKVKKVKFIDSLKIIPLSVEEIAKSFGLEISKLKIDYNLEREKGHVLTKEEEDYIKNDVLIVAKSLKTLFDENLKKMTQGANALSDFKGIIGDSKFLHYFPQIEYEVDSDLRKAYRGGFTYLNPIYKEKDVGAGVVLDVNSLYPSVMYEKELPFGEPIFYEGKYKNDRVYPLYIQMITCSFELKKNKIPTIQIKNNKSFFRSNEYLESSKNEIVCLTLTNIDLDLFLEQYEVRDLNYVAGWKFKSIKGIFEKYIDKWTERKIKAGIENNKGQRTLAKLMLNSLYGKLATSQETVSKIPYLDENEILHYEFSQKELKDGVYLPGGIFITSYAREKTIRTSQAIKDYSIKKYGKDLYCYSDTDSIHCLLPIEELKQFCEIDDYKLGYWKHESSFEKARFIRQKCYMEYFDGEMNITCAGMPKTCYKNVTWENFHTGLSVEGKLAFKNIKGGVLLVPTDFTIKDL